MVNLTNGTRLLPEVVSYCLAPTNLTQFLTNPSPPDLQVVIWEYISGAFCLFGGSANLILLILIQRSQALRRGAGILVAHLLACHVAYFAVILPLIIARVRNVTTLPRITERDCEVCRLQHFITMTCGFVIGWTDALLALNRIVGVMFPVKYRLLDRPLVHGCGLLLGWLLTLSMTIPPFFGYHSSFKMGGVGKCTYIPQNTLFVLWLSFNVYCPLAIATGSAVLISARFGLNRLTGVPQVHPRTPGVNGNAPSRNAVSRRQGKMSRMLVTSFLINFACQIPLFLLIVTNWISRYPLLSLWTICLFMVQCSSAPVIFLALNGDYRKLFVNVYGRLRGQNVAASSQPQAPSRTLAKKPTIEPRG
ncbi:hypothetical protein BV898_13435 [Hypsibius exemplaris]|uniref:G-protein coupled receptors family 1 profile domain-containing protein n=1 Tax=Hypsibius exemplaris TaxID=2072580 RepID=A0A1W0WAS3_HYPEX|nr:hypothetical protein BV898_13435 [Hypsibius exemplaris]